MSAWTDAVAAIATAPSAWYRVNGNFNDSTGNARHLTERSSGVPTAYVAGTTNDGDQAVHGYGTLAYASWMNPPSALSFVAWFKSDGSNPFGIMGRADSIAGSYFYNQWRCYVDGSGNIVLEVVQANAVPAGNITTTGHNYRDSAWHMVAGVWKSGNLKLYIDGTLYATASSGVAAALYGDVTWPLSLGCFGGSSGGINNPVTGNAGGTVDEGLVWYGYELTALEVGDLYDAPFLPVPPSVPTSVTVDTITADAATIHWGAPVSGDPPTGYVIRLDHDAGTDHAEGFAVFDYEWTGLDPSTTYTLSVAAYNFGGTSAFVDVEFDTLSDGPTEPAGAYQADIRIGDHTWTIAAGDPADPDVVNVLAGASYVWSGPDDSGWPPPLHRVPRDVLTLRLFSADAADFEDVKRGQVARFRFTPAGYTFVEPLIDFAGTVRDLRITDRPEGGAYMNVAAVDHGLVLEEWLIHGDTNIGNPGDSRAEILTRISDVLDTFEASENRDYVPGTFGDVLAGSDADPDDFAGTVLDTFTIEAGQEATAASLFAHYGMTMFPLPNYDPDTGELDPAYPFLIRWIDPGAADWVAVELSAAKAGAGVPTANIEWRRDYIPNVIDLNPGDPTVGGIAGMIWAGGNVGVDDPPPYPEWTYARLPAVNVNRFGVGQEVAEPHPFGAYTFVVLASRDPESVRGFFLLPDRYRQYVTITDIDPLKNPGGVDSTSGMLRNATFTIGPLGEWNVTAGLRTSRGHVPADDA